MVGSSVSQGGNACSIQPVNEVGVYISAPSSVEGSRCTFVCIFFIVGPSKVQLLYCWNWLCAYYFRILKLYTVV